MLRVLSDSMVTNSLRLDRQPLHFVRPMDVIGGVPRLQMTLTSLPSVLSTRSRTSDYLRLRRLA